MSARIPSDTIDFPAISSTEQLPNGAILLHTAQSTDDRFVSATNSPFWQQIGFASRPAKPTTAGAAETVVFVFGNENQAFASRDLRCSLHAGLEPGETVIYAGGPSNSGTGQIRLSDDGVAEIKIEVRKGNSSSGDPVRITVSSEGEIEINAGGRGRIRITETGIELGDVASLSAAIGEQTKAAIDKLVLAIASATAGANPIVFNPLFLPPTPTETEAILSSVVKVMP